MKYFNLFLTLAIIGLLYSCYPKGAEYVDELDTYVSKFDPDYFKPGDFVLGTFAMPEEITYYKNGKLVEDHDHTYDPQILGLFENNMKNVGYTPVSAGEDTVFAVSADVHELTQAGYIYPPYWGGPWYPYYPGGWYPWYPWYPGGGYWYPWYPTYYSFQTGTVIFRIGNISKRDTVNDTVRVPIIYVGAIDGLLQGSQQYINQRVEAGINQLFEQAPFDKSSK